MAVIAPLAGWYAARAAGALLPARRWAVLAAAFVAAWLSVVAASVGFVAEYALGGAGAVDLGAVFWAMVGVHAVIGIGEGLITVAIVSAVVATRPDLVRIARTIQPSHAASGRSRRRVIGTVVAGLAIAVALAWVVAPLASGDPDGLERVAIDQGFADTATDSPVAGSPLAEYGVDGLAGEQAGTGISGTAGIVAAFSAGVVLIGGARWVVMRARASKPA
jgi:cobalt/nickel transport system permease protein